MTTSTENKEVKLYTFLDRPVKLVQMSNDGTCIIENEKRKLIKINKNDLKQINHASK